MSAGLADIQKDAGGSSVRCNIRVQQDVAVFEILGFRAGDEVFLQRIATFGWSMGDGGLVDAEVGHGADRVWIQYEAARGNL